MKKYSYLCNEERRAVTLLSRQLDQHYTAYDISGFCVNNIFTCAVLSDSG